MKQYKQIKLVKVSTKLRNFLENNRPFNLDTAGMALNLGTKGMARDDMFKYN